MENDEASQNAGSDGDKGSNDMQSIYKDEVDRLPNNCHVTNWDIFVLMMSICSHICDVALDLNLAYRYYKNQEYHNFSLTVLFIYFPAFVNTFISHRMYDLSEDDTSSSRMAVKKWTVRIFVLVFQLAPVMRYCDSLDYAMKSRKAERRMDRSEQVRYYQLMLKEDGDVALLRVFECFLEAAPQQILQLSIIISRWRPNDSKSAPGQKTFTLIHQCGSIGSSVLSMAWSMASYHRSIRLCQKDKLNISLMGTAVQFLWHFNITVSRILSITAVAYQYPEATAGACCIHWIVMTIWLALFENTQFVVKESTWRAKISEAFFCGILGLVYIFTYLTPSEGSTRRRYLVYYPICFCENVAAVIIFGVTSGVKGSWFYVPMIVSGILPFLIGLAFMALFYKLLHPQTSSRRVHSAENGGRTDADVQTSSISLAA